MTVQCISVQHLTQCSESPLSDTKTLLCDIKLTGAHQKMYFPQTYTLKNLNETYGLEICAHRL